MRIFLAALALGAVLVLSTVLSGSRVESGGAPVGGTGVERSGD